MKNWWLLFWLLGVLPLHAQIDSTKTAIVGEIHVQGNDITKSYIIERELSFQEGDTIRLYELPSIIERSKDNVFNLGLFHSVTIIHTPEDSLINFSINVAERWYIWPFLILENADRNFNTWWQNKDFDRLSYGIFLDWRNFRGRNEKLQIRAKTGFEQTLSLGYAWPYINKKRTLGLSIGTGYSTNKEVNTSSEENKQIFIKDDDKALRERYHGNVRLQVRQKLYTRHEVTLGVSAMHVTDTIQMESTEYLKGNASFNSLFYLSYLFKYDKRDYIDYPLKGSVFELFVVKQGIGVLDNENLNLLELKSSFRNHIHLGGRLYAANSLNLMTNLLDNPSYAYQRGLGFNNNFIRGYELYVMDAQHYGFTKSNIKWELIKPKVKKIKQIPLEKFNTISYAAYLNVFCDVGYAFDDLYAELNPLSNEWLLGYGVGLDVVTYYDIVMRAEYAFTNNGENGLFLHFKKPI